MYFTNGDGQYIFNGADLKEAHEWCQSQVEMAMIFNHTSGLNENIVVSNTFTQEWEMEAYYKLAESYGYRVFSLVVESRHQSGNIHNVPEEVIEKMRERFSIFL